jgi:hypothetical protein
MLGYVTRVVAHLLQHHGVAHLLQHRVVAHLLQHRGVAHLLQHRGLAHLLQHRGVASSRRGFCGRCSPASCADLAPGCPLPVQQGFKFGIYTDRGNLTVCMVARFWAALKGTIA